MPFTASRSTRPRAKSAIKRLTDLLKLADQFKILSKRKYGNQFVFVAPSDLGQKLVDVELLPK